VIENIAVLVSAFVLGGFGGIALCRKFGCRLPKPKPKAKGKKR